MTKLFVLRRVGRLQVVWTIRQKWRAAVGGLRRGRGRAEGGTGRAPIYVVSPRPATWGRTAHPTRPQCVSECWSDAGMIFSPSNNITSVIII